MKLGLLVVMAMVILAPSLSDGWMVSKCELKEKLWKSNILPKTFPEKLKEKILAIVICELNRRSHLNTSHEEVLGQREMTTTTPAMETTEAMTTQTTTTEEMSDDEMTTEEMTTEEVTTEEVTTEEVTTEEVTTEEMTTEEVTTEEVTTEEVTTEEMTTEEVTTEEVTTEEVTTEEMTTEEVTTEEMTTEEVTTEEMTTDTETTTQPSQTTLETGKKRRKREVDMSSEEYDLTAMEMNMYEMANLQDNKYDEKDIETAENKIDNEDDDSNEANDDELELGEHEEGNGEAFSMPKKKKQWSLGSYGIFQLSDGYHCNSGHRCSINKCNTSCNAFADEDITDDIACLVKTGFWRRFFYESCSECFHIRDYFKSCQEQNFST